MNLTQDEKTKIDSLLQKGFRTDRIKSIIDRDRQELVKSNQREQEYQTNQNDGIIFGDKSLTSSIGKGLTSAGSGIVDTFKDIGKGYEEKGLAGGVLKTLQAPLGVAGALGGGVGEVAGGVLETLDDLTGEAVSGVIKEPLQELMSSDVAQEIGKGFKMADDFTGGALGQTLKSTELLGVKPTMQGLSKLKNIKNIEIKKPDLNFQDIFKRKKTTGKTTDTPTVKEYGALEEALESKKTGLTTENRGVVSKFLDSETDIMQPYQKKALTVADPKDFKEAMDTIIMRNKDLNNPSLHEFAIKKVEKAIDKYSDVNKKAGKIIGDSRLKMDKSTYNKWGDLKDTKIRPIVDDFLSKNGYKYENGDIIKSSKKSTAFSPEDKTLLKESLEIIYDNDKSITGGDLRRLVDDLNSDFNKKGSQSLAKSIGKDIRDFRNSKLNKKELESYKKYSETIDFINEFKNSKNPAQKISTFLNTSGTSRDFKIKDIASELKKHTGTDINEIANLTRVLVERLPKGDSNLTSFAQLMGNANIPMSAFGIAETGAQMSKGLLKKMFGADIMSEMNKAGLTKYKK